MSKAEDIIPLELTRQEIASLVNMLGEFPYKKVRTLIDKLVSVCHQPVKDDDPA